MGSVTITEVTSSMEELPQRTPKSKRKHRRHRRQRSLNNEMQLAPYQPPAPPMASSSSAVTFYEPSPCEMQVMPLNAALVPNTMMPGNPMMGQMMMTAMMQAFLQSQRQAPAPIAYTDDVDGFAPIPFTVQRNNSKLATILVIITGCLVLGSVMLYIFFEVNAENPKVSLFINGTVQPEILDNVRKPGKLNR